MRTRTAVPTRDRPVRHEQCAAVERELHEPAVWIGVRHDGVEHRAESDRFSQPRQIGTTHERRHRPDREALSSLQHQHVRGQPHHVVEVVRDEDERHVERSPQRVDLVLKGASHDAIDGGKRFVEQQDGRLARQRSGERDALPFAARQLAGRRVIRSDRWTSSSSASARARRSARGR